MFRKSYQAKGTFSACVSVFVSVQRKYCPADFVVVVVVIAYIVQKVKGKMQMCKCIYFERHKIEHQSRLIKKSAVFA